MSVVPEPVIVRPYEAESRDRTTVVAIDGDGSIVGRATLSCLYGPRAEVHLELAPSPTITLALIAALEREARKHRLARLELDATRLSEATVAALRRWRPVTNELRASHLHLTWPTTPVNS